MSLYCVTHKPLEYELASSIRQLQVGDGVRYTGAYRDNSDDNISQKNRTYSELTGHYYVWKNLPSQWVGFCHYRRFLVPPSQQKWARDNLSRPFEHLPTEGKGEGNYASGYTASLEQLNTFFSRSGLGSETSEVGADFKTLLEDCDIVLPASNPVPNNDLVYQYTTAHPSYAIFALLKLMSERDHYLGKAAYEFFTSAESAHWNNLFVCRWDVFDDYCEFLFDLLFELEETLMLPICPYQRRVFAFLSERLLNFWVWYRSLTVAECPWVLLSDDCSKVSEKHQSNPVSQNIFNADWRSRLDTGSVRQGKSL